MVTCFDSMIDVDVEWDDSGVIVYVCVFTPTSVDGVVVFVCIHVLNLTVDNMVGMCLLSSNGILSRRASTSRSATLDSSISE